MSGKIIYEEDISSARTEALFVALACVFLVLLYWRMAVAGLGVVAGILLFLALLFIFYAFNYRVLTIRISADHLYLRFGVFRWKIPLDNIDGACIDGTSLWRISGAGIHFSSIGGRYRAMFNFLEHPRVVVALKQKKGLVRDVAFSTARPREVIQIIESVAASTGAG